MKNQIKITWKVDDGREIIAESPIGQTLMEAALRANVPGVKGECGGAMACATCHVVVEYSPEKLDPPERGELEMLDFAEVAPKAGSRLSCQIRAVASLDGIVLKVPYQPNSIEYG